MTKKHLKDSKETTLKLLEMFDEDIKQAEKRQDMTALLHVQKLQNSNELLELKSFLIMLDTLEYTRTYRICESWLENPFNILKWYRES